MPTSHGLDPQNQAKSVTMPYRYVVCGGDSYENYSLPGFATDSLEKAKEYISNEEKSGYSHDWYTVVDLENLEEVYSSL